MTLLDVLVVFGAAGAALVASGLTAREQAAAFRRSDSDQ